MSPKQRETLGRLLSNRTPPHELMKWRLRLYCSHVVERTAHYTHKSIHAAFTGGLSCPECGLDPAVIVDGEAIGLLEHPARAQAPESLTGEPTRAHKPTKAELEARVRELEAEVARLQGD